MENKGIEFLRLPRSMSELSRGGQLFNREETTTLAGYFKKNVVLARRQDCGAGTLIFSEADRADGIYFIESGMVRITRKVPEIQKDISLALLGPGECFGVVSFMTRKSRRADAMAVTNCVLWEVDRGAFHEIVTRSPAFARLVIQGLLKRLEEVHAEMKDTTEQMVEFTRRMDALANLWHSLVTWG